MTVIRRLLRAVAPGKVEARLADRYRPELHYMRGPGPKCAERSRSQPREAAPIDRPARARTDRGSPSPDEPS